MHANAQALKMSTSAPGVRSGLLECVCGGGAVRAAGSRLRAALQLLLLAASAELGGVPSTWPGPRHHALCYRSEKE